jgi:hypothetical protein
MLVFIREGLIHLLAFVNGVFISTAVLQHVKEMTEEKWDGDIYISNTSYYEYSIKTKSMAERSG